ncbi:MAG: hypothetical protein HKM87_05035, partial [Ignavibacteriaceae bacterium]|nr:hypothetical protein [Ignavibacteriaceae bacterium]
MKKTILSFLFFFLFAGLINVLAQEGEESEDAFINPLFQSTGTSSFFDGQYINGSNWEWMHPTPSGSSLYWVQVIDANTWF